MGEGRGDGCERQAVGHGKRCGKKEGAVGLVSLDIKRRVGVDDFRDVVLLPGIVKGV